MSKKGPKEKEHHTAPGDGVAVGGYVVLGGLGAGYAVEYALRYLGILAQGPVTGTGPLLGIPGVLLCAGGVALCASKQADGKPLIFSKTKCQWPASPEMDRDRDSDDDFDPNDPDDVIELKNRVDELEQRLQALEVNTNTRVLRERKPK